MQEAFWWHFFISWLSLHSLMSHKNKFTLPDNQDRTKQPKVGSLINQGHFAPCYKSNVYVLIFTLLRSLGRQRERLANNYISYVSIVRRIRQQLWDGLFIRGVQVSIFRKTSGLTRKFNIGRDRKQDPNQVAKDMWIACTIDGERMFNRTEWLSNIQILGLFSRLRLKQRSKKQQESNDTTDSDDGDDDLMEA